MAEPRRLVHLPGYDDTARDIYETPEFTDDGASTTLTQATSPRSPSSSSHTSNSGSDSDDEQRYGGVSRRRLYPERARSRFGAVQTGGNVDLSDRVDGRRRGYRIKSSRRRRGTGEDGDGFEGLEARIARLRREIEECKVEAEKEGVDAGMDEQTDLEGLERLLGTVEVSQSDQRQRRGTGGGRTAPVARGGGARAVTPGAWPDGEEGDTSDAQILGKVADFDSRLSALEHSLGISALDAAALDSASSSATTPVLPSLTLLDAQVATLISAGSLASLETASARIQKLRSEAEYVSAQSTSQTTSQSRPSTGGSTEGDKSTSQASPALLSAQDTAKVHSLYALLPTLQSLAPTVPALLNRLHSLRTLHANAASAAQELDEVEKRQRTMDSELKAWRQGVEKAEAAVAEAREANGSNGKVVEKWVRELEGRMKSLGR